MKNRVLVTLGPFCAAAALVGLSGMVQAVDGVILIDQARILSGNITPGDAPGFPATISQSGSYRLAGNIMVPDANTTAIRVSAENVTIDLNGFAILGPTRCTKDSSGMVTSCLPAGGGRGIEGGTVIRNGTVKGMGEVAVQPFGEGARVQEVSAESNGGGGIACTDRCAIVRSSAIHNGGIGIFLNSGGMVDNSLSYGNASFGFYFSGYSQLYRSRAERNGDIGIYTQGILIATENVVSSNGSAGISVGGSSTIIGNLVIDNGVRGSGEGITEGGLSVIQNNVVVSNRGGGISAKDGTVIRGNSVTGGILGGGLKMFPTTGYGNNVIQGNEPLISGGTQLEPNLCQNALCK